MPQTMSGSLDPKGPSAEVAANLWWFMLLLGLVVFGVFLALLWAGLRRQAPPDTEVDRDEGRRWLVGGGVVMPAVVLVAVFGATLGAMRAWPNTAPKDSLVIEVVGHQWWYEVRYPEQGVTLKDRLHIPVGRPVVLRLTSADVIHSFWVPELGGKLDMLPEDTNVLVLQADTPGRYKARCAEFCGLHHADMHMVVVAQAEDRFTAWMGRHR
jgi:cytochrome c oxidase subunit 2